MSRRVCGAIGLVACACQPAPPPHAAVDSTPPTVPVVRDSLLFTAPHEVEVWFTDARAATDSAGNRCVERVLQIRREGRRIPVPLLYTGTAPRLVNDSTIEAPIWRHCRPGNVYRVSLRSGQPVRVR